MQSHLGKARRLEPLLSWCLLLLSYQSPYDVTCHHMSNTGLPCWTQTAKWSDSVPTHPRPWAQDQREVSAWLLWAAPSNWSQGPEQGWENPGSGKGGKTPCLESPLLHSAGGPRVGEDRAPGLLPRWHDGYPHMVLFLSKFTREFQWS